MCFYVLICFLCVFCLFLDKPCFWCFFWFCAQESPLMVLSRPQLVLEINLGKNSTFCTIPIILNTSNLISSCRLQFIPGSFIKKFLSTANWSGLDISNTVTKTSSPLLKGAFVVVQKIQKYGLPGLIQPEKYKIVLRYVWLGLPEFLQNIWSLKEEMCVIAVDKGRSDASNSNLLGSKL